MLTISVTQSPENAVFRVLVQLNGIVGELVQAADQNKA